MNDWTLEQVTRAIRRVSKAIPSWGLENFDRLRSDVLVSYSPSQQRAE